MKTKVYPRDEERNWYINDNKDREYMQSVPQHFL